MDSILSNARFCTTVKLNHISLKRIVVTSTHTHTHTLSLAVSVPVQIMPSLNFQGHTRVFGLDNIKTARFEVGSGV